MIEGLKPYPKMKDSGVPWLGRVPEHWEIRKLRQVLDRVTERNRPDLPLLSVVRERGVILRDIHSADENHNFIPDDLSNYKVVRCGQFAMNKMKAWQGSYGISRNEGIVSPAYFVFDVAGVDGDFFHRAIRSRAYVPSFTQASDGVRVGQWDLSIPRMREIEFACPKPSEQAAIATFLAHADRRIRRLIRSKQKLITLLEEQKQAIIHRAVTRGLDQSLPLKASGIEWLGDIPQHWRVARAASVCRLISAKAHEQFVEPDGEHICVTARFVSTNGRSFRRCTKNLSPALRGDVLMVMSDLPRGRALARTFLVSDEQSYAVNQRVCILRSHGVEPRFLSYVANRHPELLAHDDGFNQTHLPNGAFKIMQLPLPPLEEQSSISDVLDRDTADIDRSSERMSLEIALLAEFRTRLISDVVTGKLDVREAAARLPADSVERDDPSDDTDPDGEEDGDSAAESVPEDGDGG